MQGFELISWRPAVGIAEASHHDAAEILACVVGRGSMMSPASRSSETAGACHVYG